ncbi:LEM domain-containing protein 1 isoform X2 [Amia ocellicauda]|uniref:LEM domain-containing protein 1 isoform X2 n=1 Tax=Amia ocellicauda TaxID=2972642 RepID=UPI003463C7EA
MPVFVDDPNRLSKERLRSELVAHNVPLPPGETRKRVFVDLYLKHVAHRTAADFSSDEEDQAPEDGSEEAGLEEEDDEGDSEVMDVHQLTDEELKAELIKYGVKPGPILATTRQLYEKKLQRLLHPSDGQKAPPDEEHYSDSEEDETGSEYQPHRAAKMPPKSGPGQNHLGPSREGSRHKRVDDFYFHPQCFMPCQRMGGKPTPVLTVHVPRPRSGPSNVCKTAPDSIQAPVSPLTPLRSTFSGLPAGPAVSPLYTSLQGLRTASSPGSPGSSFSIARLVEELESRSPSTPPAATERLDSVGSNKTGSATMVKSRGGPAEDDVLQEMFPNEVRTPTGISATRRRPIKGAAGRPVQFKYSDLVPLASSGGLDSLGLSRRLVPIWAQVLVFLLLAGFLFVLYCAMEANSDNPFTEYIDNASTGSEVMQEPPPAMDAQLPLTRQE